MCSPRKDIRATSDNNNHGNVYVQRQDYAHAIDNYTRAIELDAHLAEAYYNRGLALIANKQEAEGVADPKNHLKVTFKMEQC